ncbi:hypothetical protein C1H46_018810 [Malus baccata]|uniref:Uncharacterized protein n=1 Tax=Malus baccata TaxID=106549 RepID=A0A540MA21_MALBA|nr:hypothetical protein C1H46_018810 [Malus baccata]
MSTNENSVNANVNPTCGGNLPSNASDIHEASNLLPQTIAMPGTSNGLQGATATLKEREDPASGTLSSMDKIWETLTTIDTSNHDQYLCREGTNELDYRSGKNSF